MSTNLSHIVHDDFAPSSPEPCELQTIRGAITGEIVLQLRDAGALRRRLQDAELHFT
jgi:hypothetical protein